MFYSRYKEIYKRCETGRCESGCTHSVPAYETIKYPEILRKYMKIGDDEDIVIGIALGYEDKENILSKIKAKKLTLDEACHFYF